MTKLNLNKKQLEIVKNSNKHTLVCAGAGTGKTTTIIGKILYLTKEKNIKENEIVCISFTNESTNSLKTKLKKLGLNISCYTFHKLGLLILKNKYKNIDINTLEYIINEFFEIAMYRIELKKLILNSFNIKYKEKNINKKFNRLKKRNITEVKLKIKRFIELFKTNNYDEKDIIAFIKREKKKRYKSTLLIIYYIYKTYQNELFSTNTLDFNDMINESTNYLKTNKLNKRIKYLIIDEFQDTSISKLNLIIELQKQTNCNLFVVGDDFQSIYKFTGCNLDIFLNFKNYFKETKTFKLEETYRNSKELISLAGNFIMKNNKQIKKELTSNKSIKKPIEIIYYKDLSKALIKLINHIYEKTNKPILILGRNNFDINPLINSKNFILENDKLIYLKNKDIKMRYLTVHKSKGLEEENVILINLLNVKNSFPNTQKESYLINYVIKKTNEIDYAEERRLFYVALTRTKNKNYILTIKGKESIFVKELIRNNRKYINFKRF